MKTWETRISEEGLWSAHVMGENKGAQRKAKSMLTDWMHHAICFSVTHLSAVLSHSMSHMDE